MLSEYHEQILKNLGGIAIWVKSNRRKTRTEIRPILTIFSIIIYRLVMINSSFDAYFDFWATFGGKMSVATRCTLSGLGGQPKDRPTRWTLWANHCLVISFLLNFWSKMILGALLIFFLMNLRLCSHIFYTHRFLEVFLRVVNILGVDPHQLCYLEPGSNLVPSGAG